VNTTNGQVTVTYKDKMGNQFSVTGSFKKRPAPGIIEAQAVLRDNAQTPPTTTPLTGVHVDLMRVLKNGSEKFIQDGDTFADGKIKFQNLSVGNNYKVLATLGGMEMFACPGLLEAAGVNVLSNATTQVVFTFDKRYGVKGKVTVFDANGNNVTQNEAANVAINVYSVQGQTENLVRTVGIAPNGDYDTGPLRGGNYRIEATHPRAANRPSSNVTIAQCQITPVTGVNFTLTLQPPQGG
jgi:5-hydroxyisourate hydrolase-like protein (transthyretin family)